MILNLVMVNFFISILDRSYVKISTIFSTNSEKYSLTKIFCFCFYKTKEVKSKGQNIEIEFEISKKPEVITFI